MSKVTPIIIAIAVAIGVFFFLQSSPEEANQGHTQSAPKDHLSFIEGQHYELLKESQATSTGDKIEVLELFWYRCGHCYDLEAPLQVWLRDGKSDNAQYVAFPAVFSERWEPAARAYYTFEALGMLNPYHTKLFTALHAEGKNIDSAQQLAAWVAAEGGDGQAILDTYHSFAVNNKVEHAKNMTKQYGIEGVPAIIVDGRYRTSVSQAGDHATLFKAVDFLVEKAAAQRN